MSDLSQLFRQIAEEQDAIRARSPGREELPERLAALALLAPASTRERARRLVIPLVAAAMMLSAFLVWLSFRDGEVLAVRVGKSSAPPLIDAWLGAPDYEPLPLLFSDGTRMDLAPRSKARLRDVRPEGARVELAQGSLQVAVTPRPATSFWVDAGPFSVHVTGTRFDVRFDPKGETLTLALAEGHVEISGCVFGQGRPLVAGQTVRASCTRRSLDVTYGDRLDRAALAATDGPEGAATALAPSAAESSRSPTEREPEVAGESPSNEARSQEGDGRSSKGDGPSSQGGARSQSGWLELAKRGAYDQAFEQARAEGFEAECARRNAKELALLADAARHAGASSEARHALLTLRSRFSGTDEAALAAFTLGRLDFDARHSPRSASGWFRTYLKERPRGSMTREAVGRLIEALEAGRDRPAARDVARRYLREYPSGPHAELASRVLSSP